MFPTSWKESLVVPIQQVSGTVLVNEFRPINKLNIFKKVLETVVKENLVEYINSNPVSWYSRQLVRLKNMPVMGSSPN